MSREFPLAFPASKRAIGCKDLQMTQVVTNPPAGVVEPQSPRAQHEFVLIVVAPGCGFLHRLLISVPKLDVRVAAFALEVVASLGADFECALEFRIYDLRRQGYPEVRFGVFSDLRSDLCFELRNEICQLGSRTEAEIKSVRIDVVGVWLPYHARFLGGFPF